MNPNQVRNRNSLWGSSGARAPTVSAVSYGFVDVLGGGQRVVVTVDSSVGCTGITAGGVAFTSFAIDNATHVSGIPGAHAAGVVDVVVTNAAGPGTGTGLIEYFDPTSLVDLYLDSTQYAVGAWTKRKGADVTQATGAAQPAVGATLGGRATVDFDGTDDRLTGAALNTYADPTHWWSLVLFSADTASSNGSPAYNNDALWTDSGNGGTGMAIKTGATVQVFGNTVNDSTSISLSTWTAAIGKYDGTKLYARLGSAAWGAGTACAGLGDGLGTSIIVGGNYVPFEFFDGRMAVLAIGKTIPSDADILKFLGVINQQWGTAF